MPDIDKAYDKIKELTEEQKSSTQAFLQQFLVLNTALLGLTISLIVLSENFVQLEINEFLGLNPRIILNLCAIGFLCSIVTTVVGSYSSVWMSKKIFEKYKNHVIERIRNPLYENSPIVQKEPFIFQFSIYFAFGAFLLSICFLVLIVLSL
jgi:hypothetical protein